MRRTKFALAAFAVFFTACAASCGGGSASFSSASNPSPTSGSSGSGGQAVRTPMNDLAAGTYLGFTGGLYPGGSNTMPAQHSTAGLARAGAVRPLDTSGNPSSSGKYVLLSIGMSNTTQEFCGGSNSSSCTSWSFMGQTAADAEVNKSALVILDGAAGGRSAGFWDSASDEDYDRVRDSVLAPRGLSERQVQVVWLKVANPGPTISLPSEQSDAVTLLMQMGNIVRALKTRYPNLKQIFVSSRIYAGYATTTLNPEPYAYESGFSVKWLVQAQIDQTQNSGTVVDQRAGNLNFNTVVPWIAWGPYLWADGTTPRSDGLLWERADLADDGTHPSQSGQRKVGQLLLNFFKTSPHTKCWFLTSGSCP